MGGSKVKALGRKPILSKKMHENQTFHPLYRAKNENGWDIFVYGSIILNFFLVALLTY